MARPTSTFRATALLIATLGILAACDTPPSAPPPASQLPKLGYDDALAKGVDAAKAQQFAQAADFFRAAHNANPAAPEPLFDLGLAEAKIPGRDLRAMAWFEAYLAVAPNAANAATVREQIKNLDTAAQANAQQLVDIVSKLTVDDANQLCAAADLAAGSDSIDQAIALNAHCRFGNQNTDLADAMAASGNVDQAFKVIDAFSDDTYRKIAYEAVISVLIIHHDFAGAEHAWDRLIGLKLDGNDVYWAVKAKLDLAVAEHMTGRTGDAIQQLNDAESRIASLQGSAVIYPTADLADALYQFGDREAAKASLDKAVSLSRQTYPDDGKTPNLHRMWRLYVIGKAAFRGSDQQLATTLFRESITAGEKSKAAGEEQYTIAIALEEVFAAELEVGDWTDARTWIASPPPGDDSAQDRATWQKEFDAATKKTATDQARQAFWRINGDPSATPETLSRIWTSYIDNALGQPVFLDFAGYVKTIHPEKDNADASLADLKASFMPYVDALADLRILIAARR